MPAESNLDRVRYLFLDLNSFFAAVEQQEDPALRGKPVAVGAVSSDAGTIIAASYEAKAFGVKTGVRVGEAKAMCPGLILRGGGHKRYLEYHHRILAAVENVLPIDKVCSVDEMRFRLLGPECEVPRAKELAEELRQEIYRNVGSELHCSIGIAPNAWLAKVGTELMKPKGLVVITKRDLPNSLYPLQLTDLPGINRKLRARLQAHGIFSVQDLTSATEKELRSAFGSVIGARWWYLLRGEELIEEPTHRRSMGHSHVLPPDLRNQQGAREVLLRLVQKLSSRMRASHLCCQRLDVHVRERELEHEGHSAVSSTHDTITLTEAALALFDQWSVRTPLQVSVTAHDLCPEESVTPSLFGDYVDRQKMSSALDQINNKFGKNTIYLAGLQQAKDTAGERIAFNKTWLFSEGKGDNELEQM